MKTISNDVLSMSKKDLLTHAKEEAEKDIEEGYINLLEVYLENKSAIDFLTDYNKSIKKEVINDFDRYCEKQVLINGRKVSTKETGVKYDFSKCNYPELETYEVSIKKDTDYLNKLKEFVKKLNKPIDVLDEETGEVYTVKPPLKTSTTTIAITY